MEMFEVTERNPRTLRARTDAKAFLFPGGESHVALGQDAPAPTEVIRPMPATRRNAHTTQVAYLHGASGDDLMTLAMWADAAKRNGHASVAFIPYLPGARQDRGVPLGAKVYADFINSLDIDRIVCVDPHSDVMPALLNRLTVINLDQLPIWPHLGTFVGVIAPDAGARKRAELVAGKLGVPIYQANKHRDFATGKLSGFTCEALPETGNLLVVDDICDAGGTFHGLAAATGLPAERLALWVTHGVFSPRAESLSERFALIATTDSHPGHDNGRLPDAYVNNLRDIMLAAVDFKEL